MYCPKCRYEYVEGIMECNDCRIPLVKVLPPGEKSPPKPWLKIASLLAITGFSYLFIVRTLNTIFPYMFTNLVLIGVHRVLSLLAWLTMVFFFVCFYKEYIHEEQKKLKTAALLVIIANAAIVPPAIINIVDIFTGVDIQRYGIYYNYIADIMPWIAVVFLFYFFITFYKEPMIKEKVRLKRTAFLAAIGTALQVLRQTFILFYYFNIKLGLGFIIDFPDKIIYTILLGIPLALFPAFTILLFFISFYHDHAAHGPSHNAAHGPSEIRLK